MNKLIITQQAQGSLNKNRYRHIASLERRFTKLLSLSIIFSMYSQSFPHTKASNVSGVSELLASPSNLPPKLKADSEDTVLRGIARKSRAMVDSIGNF